LAVIKTTATDLKIQNNGGKNLLRPFSPVFGPTLFAIGYPDGVQGAADDMITDPGQVFHPSPPDQDHGMFLEVMPDPRDIGGHLHAVRQTNPGDLSQGGIRLLGR
jgi:hypothetical protein